MAIIKLYYVAIKQLSSLPKNSFSSLRKRWHPAAAKTCQWGKSLRRWMTEKVI